MNKQNGLNESDLVFLHGWLRVLFQLFPEARGKVNGVSIALTGLYIAIDRENTLEVVQVEETK